MQRGTRRARSGVSLNSLQRDLGPSDRWYDASRRQLMRIRLGLFSLDRVNDRTCLTHKFHSECADPIGGLRDADYTTLSLAVTTRDQAYQAGAPATRIDGDNARSR